jgi:hypothetical protein
VQKQAAVATLCIAAASLAAVPISLHFEGNNGSAEPFLYVLPISVVAAVGGVIMALRIRAQLLLALNGLAATSAFVFWIALLTYEGD